MTDQNRQPQPEEIANQLHSAAIHLLRRLRVQDAALGLSARRLSALSVIVFAGPIPVSELAEAEQVRVPTISRLVKELEYEGLVERLTDSSDGRIQLIQATEAGANLLHEGRRRRIAVFAADIAQLPPDQQALLAEAAALLADLNLPPDHPQRQTAE